jgi:amidase
VLPVQLPLFEPAYAAGLTLINRENWLALSPLIDDPRLGADVAARLRAAGQTTDEAVAQAEGVRRAFTAEVDQALGQCGVLALPTLGAAPPRLEEAADTLAAVAMTRLVRPFNLSGHPAITLPLNDAAGLPVGLQLVGRRGDDEHLCAVARLLSQQLSLFARIGTLT